MTSARFRLDSVTIEGFKAFTNSQSIPIGGKHVFVFGPNGYGKSSILEAIRWCLFGLRDRPETEVRNTFYPSGECQVQLRLLADDGAWQLTRRLRPGADRSRLIITNPKGQEQRESDIFPHLARMGPKEGTHIIFAAQQASQRRPQADISDFDKVLYSYLNVEDVPALLDRLDTRLEEQTVARERVSTAISEMEVVLRERLNQAILKLEELLRNPPWASEMPPVGSETQAKIDDLLSELSNLTGNESGKEGQALQKLMRAEQWIQELAKVSIIKFQAQLADTRSKIASVKDLWRSHGYTKESVESIKSQIDKIRVELDQILRGQSPDDLSTRLDEVRSQLSQANRKLSIIKETKGYLEEYHPAHCPVCLTEYNPDELLHKIKAGVEQTTPEQDKAAQRASELENRCQEANRIKNQLNILQTQATKADHELSSIASKLCSILGVANGSFFAPDLVESRIRDFEKSEEALVDQLTNSQTTANQWKKRIADLRQEVRFHQYRDEKERLYQQLSSGLEPSHDQLAQLVELEKNVRDIREAIYQSFREALDRTLPHLSAMMTEVYLHLTQQVSFDTIHIEQTNTSEKIGMRIRVGSRRSPEGLYDPEDVLNGQANNALRLVPYFVFSQFQAEALELDLLLVDDPSQSFDTSHVDLLIQELTKAGSHAQIVVATHEEFQFNPEIKKHFELDQYRVVRVESFDPEKGPTVAVA